MLHLHIFQHFVDALLDLRFRIITRQAHLRGIVECTLDSQIAMNNIFLWHVAKLCAESGEMPVIVLAVVEHQTFLGGPQAVEGIHQH